MARREQIRHGAYTWRSFPADPGQECWEIEPAWREALGVMFVKFYGPLVEGRPFSGWRVVGGSGQFETREAAFEAARVQLNERASALTLELRARADRIQKLLER